MARDMPWIQPGHGLWDKIELLSTIRYDKIAYFEASAWRFLGWFFHFFYTSPPSIHLYSLPLSFSFFYPIFCTLNFKSCQWILQVTCCYLLQVYNVPNDFNYNISLIWDHQETFWYGIVKSHWINQNIKLVYT